MDNYYSNCPAKGLDPRGLTNYKSSSVNDEYIKYNYGIYRNDDFRSFLQKNGANLIDAEWEYLKTTESCWNTACTHNYPLRMDPRKFVEERENTDKLFTQRALPDNFKCKYYADYRATSTPLQIASMSKQKNGVCKTCQ